MFKATHLPIKLYLKAKRWFIMATFGWGDTPNFSLFSNECNNCLHTIRCEPKFVGFLYKHKEIGCAICPVFALGLWKINLPCTQWKLFANHLVRMCVPALTFGIIKSDVNTTCFFTLCMSLPTQKRNCMK